MGQAAAFIRKKLAQCWAACSHWLSTQPEPFEATPDIPVDNLFHSSTLVLAEKPDRHTRPALYGSLKSALFFLLFFFRSLYAAPFWGDASPGGTQAAWVGLLSEPPCREHAGGAANTRHVTGVDDIPGG